MELTRRIVIVMCASLLVMPVILKSRTNQEMPARAAFSTLSGSRIFVKVGGAVRHPGVYDVAANEMTGNVIKLAEPVSLIGLPAAAVLARPLAVGSAVELELQQDGSQVVKIGNMTVSERMILGVPLDITSMNEADFDRLPGIGPALSCRIIKYRQKNGGYLRARDLTAIEGIGENKYAKIKKYFQHP